MASGPGYIAAAAHARGATTTGIDVAAEMVALAQSLQPASGSSAAMPATLRF